MKHYMGFWAFIKTVFSEDDGRGSYSRVASFLSLNAAIAWVSLVVVKTHVIPPLTDLTLFITSAYAINKAHDAATNMFGNNTNNPPVPPPPPAANPPAA